MKRLVVFAMVALVSVIQLLELEGNAIAKMTSFVTPTLSSVFGLPTLLEGPGS